MATILKYGAPFPFGIAVTNPIYSIDPYAGPYENEADALAVFPAALREVGRAIGIYTDATKKAVKVYNWEKNASDAWVLKPQAGEYELTSAKVISALGYTPIANTHASNGVTTAKITNWDSAVTNSHTHSNKSTLDTITAQRMLGWDGKMDKVTENGNIVKVLGLDAENNAKNAEVVDIIGIWDSNTAPTEQELIESFPNALFVYAVAITPRVMYLKAGVEWKKVNLTDI